MEIKLKKELAAEKLRQAIRSGKFPVGSKLPRGTELAGKLGVSHITLRAAFKELAAEGYISSIHGRGTFVIGNGVPAASAKVLVLRDFSFGLRNAANYILPGFERRCCELGILTETVSAAFLRSGSRRNLPRVLTQNGFTAILMAGGGFTENDPLAGLLRSAGLPVLAAHGTPLDRERTGFSVMRTDYRTAWDDGVKFLLSAGKKRIAMLINSDYKIRYYSDEEILRRFAELGAASDPGLLAGASADRECFEAAMTRLLAARPEAVFCGSDFFAMLACEFLAGRKIKVPDDVAVLGFGGYPGGGLCSPGLSTVDFRYDAIGVRAAELLLDPRALADPGFDIFTPHRILIRSSAIKTK